MGWSQEQIIVDILNQYEDHLHFLHTSGVGQGPDGGLLNDRDRVNRRFGPIRVNL